MKNKIYLSLALLAAVMFTYNSNAWAQHEVFASGADIKWVDAPPSLPAGTKIAVLEGNPKMEGPFTMRVKFASGVRIAPHWHPGVEHVTVISGTFYLGMGEKFDETSAAKINAGGFSFMQPKTAHFAWFDEETVLQVHGMGPWGITYINPDDDPSNKVK